MQDNAPRSRRACGQAMARPRSHDKNASRARRARLAVAVPTSCLPEFFIGFWIFLNEQVAGARRSKVIVSFGSRAAQEP